MSAIKTAARIQTPDDARGRARPLAAPAPAGEFVGQEALREQLAVAIEAAAGRGEALDHLLLAGPPGLGKTSLAQIVASELEVPFVQTAGPALERKGDIAAFLTALEPRSVFFVDEIHRLPRALEETFYPAMEDHRLPITVGQGAGARVVTLELPPFTLVGATTRAGLLTTPLRDRFGIQARLEPYAIEELAAIVGRSAGILEIALEDGGARAIAARSRGTPRVANRLLKRVRDYARGAHGGRGDGRRRARGAGAAGGRRAGAGPSGPRDPARDLREVRRRAGGAVDARGRGGRGAGHDRGRLRALSAARGADQAHPARARRDAGGVRAPGPASHPRSAARRCPRRCYGPRASSTRTLPRPADPAGQCSRPHPRLRLPASYLSDPCPIPSSAPTAAIAPARWTATSASRASPRAARSAASPSCSNCWTTTTPPPMRRSSCATARGA